MYYLLMNVSAASVTYDQIMHLYFNFCYLHSYWGVYKAATVLGLAVGTRDAAVNKVSGVLDIRPVEGNNVQTK